MATELQYEYFQKLYEEENERYKDLAARGRFLLGLQTLYASALALKFKEFMEFAQGTKLPMQAIGAVGVLTGIGLLFTILGMRIRAYEAPSEPNAMIQHQNFDNLRDSEFIVDRLADFAVATARNSDANDRVAGLLEVSGWFTFLVVGLQMLAFAWFVFVR
jgi:hypothetical protein